MYSRYFLSMLDHSMSNASVTSICWSDFSLYAMSAPTGLARYQSVFRVTKQAPNGINTEPQAARRQRLMVSCSACRARKFVHDAVTSMTSIDMQAGWNVIEICLAHHARNEDLQLHVNTPEVLQIDVAGWRERLEIQKPRFDCRSLRRWWKP